MRIFLLIITCLLGITNIAAGIIGHNAFSYVNYTLAGVMFACMSIVLYDYFKERK